MIKRVFSTEELMKVERGSLTYYMASELKKMGAPIKFCATDIDLRPRDIKIYGKLRDRIKPDGSHEFMFEPDEAILAMEGRE